MSKSNMIKSSMNTPAMSKSTTNTSATNASTTNTSAMNASTTNAFATNPSATNPFAANPFAAINHEYSGALYAPYDPKAPLTQRPLRADSGEMAKKIRRIEITSNKLVDEIFSGEYKSGFRGKGMEFEDIRQYIPGDDVRSIDWNVTARYDKVFIKQFVEEREMNIFLLIDMSRSNSFGHKKDLIAEISATLAFSATHNNDRVGVMFFTEKAEKLIPSKSGKKHVLSIIENILRFEPEHVGTNIGNALKYFSNIEKKRSVVFLISDFLDNDYEKELNATNGRHDLILIRVVDRAEERIPAGAIFTFEDLETGETYIMDNMKRDYHATVSTGKSKRNLITIYTDEDYIKPLRQFFRKRRR